MAADSERRLEVKLARELLVEVRLGACPMVTATWDLDCLVEGEQSCLTSGHRRRQILLEVLEVAYRVAALCKYFHMSHSLLLETSCVHPVVASVAASVVASALLEAAFEEPSSTIHMHLMAVLPEPELGP